MALFLYYMIYCATFFFVNAPASECNTSLLGCCSTSAASENNTIVNIWHGIYTVFLTIKIAVNPVNQKIRQRISSL